jgi:hypothetical protein
MTTPDPSSVIRCLDHVRELANDRTPEKRVAAREKLAKILRAVPPLDRTWIASEWATSPSDREREALASALAEPVTFVGKASALEHLAHDPMPAVRELATRARAA